MWRIVPPTPVPTLPVGVWVKGATLISNDKNAAERKINPSGSREQSEKELSLQSLNLIAVTPKRLKQTKIALCMVVVVETPTRLLLRPRTPKRRAFIYLNLIDMTQVFEALLNEQKEWRSAITEKTAAAIESYNRLQAAFNETSGLILDFYQNLAAIDQDKQADEINKGWYEIENAIEKRLIYQISIEAFAPDKSH